MQVLNKVQIKTFQSWDREQDRRSTLMIANLETGVQIIHSFPNSFHEKSSMVLMCKTEAAVIGGAIRKVLKELAGSPRVVMNNWSEEAPGIAVEVCKDTQGEPYEEGIQVIFTDNGREVFYSSYNRYEASKLAEMLEACI